MEPRHSRGGSAFEERAESASFESVVITHELEHRASRSPDYAAENLALNALLDAVENADGSARVDRVLQDLAEMALELCSAHSAGVSTPERLGDKDVIRHRAVAGRWARFHRACHLREHEPAAAALERNATILMSDPQRYYGHVFGPPPIAEALFVPFHEAGEPVGVIWIVAHDETRRFEREDVRLMHSLARCAGAVHRLLELPGNYDERADSERSDPIIGTQIERLHVLQNRLRARQSRLGTELKDSKSLQRVTSELVHEERLETLCEKVVDAAVEIMGSDAASVQMFHAEPGDIELLAFRGLSNETARPWKHVALESRTLTAKALRTRRRIIVSDVECSELVRHLDSREAFRAAGIRAMLSMPLRSFKGQLVGVLSTHWRTPHRPSERELRALDLVASQAADLIHRTQTEGALKEAELRKDEFLAVLAHELRNPLAPIRSAAAFLRAKSPLPPDIEAVRGVLERQTRQLARIVDDLLDVSRISRQRLVIQKERIELGPVIQEAVEASRPMLDQLAHELNVAVPPRPIWIHGDSARLIQVFSNLLHNAAKFSDIAGRIDVAVARADDDAVVSVRDRGIGIAADKLELIFEAFSPHDRASEARRGGLGLGLKLVKQFVEMHGGSVVAMSRGVGEGSEFIVRLPALRDDAAVAT